MATSPKNVIFFLPEVTNGAERGGANAPPFAEKKRVFFLLRFTLFESGFAPKKSAQKHTSNFVCSQIVLLH